MKKNYLIFLILFVISLLIVSCVMFIGLLYFTQSTDNINLESEDSRSYIASEFNPFTNKSKELIVKIQSKFPKGYVAFPIPSGNYITISPFSKDRYECTGSCLCEDERRAFATAVSKSLYFFVAAASSVFAVSLASNYFKNYCENKYSPICSSVDSELEECLKVMTEIEENVYDKEEILNWRCEGWCQNFQDVVITENEEESEIDLELQKDLNKFNKVYKPEQDKIKCKTHSIQGVVSGVMTANAIFRFRHAHLSPFCLNVGLVENIPGELVELCAADDYSIKCVPVKANE